MELVLLGGSRTPFGKFGGGLQSVSATDLAVFSAKETLKRSGISPDQIDDVIIGNVCQSSSDAIYLARHVGLKSEVPQEVPALTVNRLCGSGLQSVVSAAQHILSQDSSLALTGGTENMSQIPYVIRKARWGYRMGNSEVEDTLTTALIDSYTGAGMAITAENLRRKYDITRQEQDEFALRSQQLALAARANGRLAKEIVPVFVSKKLGSVEQDEHMRETTLDKLQSLRAAFEKDGTVTAGNASGINDGAATLIVTTESKSKQLNANPMAKIKSWGIAGVDPTIMGIGPAPACRKALQKASLKLEDIDLIEINEAFAAQYIAVEKELGLDRDKVNVNGGAIALGHPLGASGARVLLTLLHELEIQQKRYGMAALCIGGGQGIAMIVENLRL